MRQDSARTMNVEHPYDHEEAMPARQVVLLLMAIATVLATMTAPSNAGAADARTASKVSYTADPVDRVMEVARRANVRAGPGTDHPVLNTLEPGAAVRVTGKVRGRKWLRIDLPEDGGTAFVYAPLLKEREPPAPPKPFGPDWIIAENQPCQLRNPNPGPGQTVTWSGACAEGKASGEGRLVWRTDKGGYTFEGSMRAGMLHGQGTAAWSDGNRYEGGWLDDRRHGRGTYTWPDGDRYEGGWLDDKPHGPGTFTWPDGSRAEGQWRNGCFEGDGRLIWIMTTEEACGFK